MLFSPIHALILMNPCIYVYRTFHSSYIKPHPGTATAPSQTYQSQQHPKPQETTSTYPGVHPLASAALPLRI